MCTYSRYSIHATVYMLQYTIHVPVYMLYTQHLMATIIHVERDTAVVTHLYHPTGLQLRAMAHTKEGKEKGTHDTHMHVYTYIVHCTPVHPPARCPYFNTYTHCHFDLISRFQSDCLGFFTVTTTVCVCVCACARACLCMCK